MKFLLALLLPAALVATLRAEAVRPIPPPGIEIPAADRAEIEAGVKKLGEEIAKLRDTSKTNDLIARELPNVEIFHKSADWAVRYGEIFDVKQIATAKDHILQGLDRAASLANAKVPRQLPWNTATGLVVRGYRSKIDGSVQPYGLLVPDNFNYDTTQYFPLNFWCHGRGEKNTELPFIAGTQNNKGEFTPEGQFVCYLFGRYCCANKFAGESDLFEASYDISDHYHIDGNKLVVRGFSMGGAAAWQFAFHFPGKWAAAAPGAGFAETEEFFHSTLYAEGATPPPWWERHLWRWYDVTICARNVAGLSLVAYSGEVDKQKQSADIMLRYAAQEGHSFTHIIGPNVPHKYHPDSKPVIEKFIEVALAKDLTKPPKSVSFTTYSLIYPKRAWVTITGMEKSWERADVDATIEKDTIIVKTKNVSELQLLPSGHEFPAEAQPKVVIDGVAISGKSMVPNHPSNKIPGFIIVLRKLGGKWTMIPFVGNDGKLVPAGPETKKRPMLCGPVDHAFMSRFLFVRPTGKPLNDAIGKWTQSEMEHAIKSWRAVFRGDAPIKDDTAVTDDDIANCNLILWGDISSNAIIKRITAEPISGTTPDRETKTPADETAIRSKATNSKLAGPLLPILWGKNELNFKAYRLDPARYAPILIYPNPLNPARYVVLNSGHTFREFALLNNSDQTPKLPDWALVDITKPADAHWPGLIFDAGFFDEHWK